MPVPQHRDLLFGVLRVESLHDDGCVLGVKLHCPTDAVGLFAGHEGGAAAAKQIHHHHIGRGTVLNGIGQQRDGLHGGMVGRLFRLIEIPDGGLLPIREPFVLAVGQPTIEHRLMLPLMRVCRVRSRFGKTDITKEIERKFRTSAMRLKLIFVLLQSANAPAVAP